MLLSNIDEDPLFKPITINNVEIRNRLVKAATQENMADDNGIINDQYCEFYKKLSIGGVGLIITGHMYVNTKGRYLRMAGIDSDAQIPNLKKVVEIVHKNGSKIFAQLNYASFKLHSRNWLPNLLNQDEIEEIIEDFGKSAERIKKAGFDGIQIHAAHNYIIAQFLSKGINRRRDRYGGSLENRQQFCVEVYESIREKVGKSFPIIIKLDSYSRSLATFPPLLKTIKIEESLDTAKKLEKKGIDAVEISCFNAARGAVPYRERIVAHLKNKGKKDKANIVNFFLRPIDLVFKNKLWFKAHHNIEHIKRFKKILSIPVIAGSCFRDPNYMRQVIKNNEADMISLARPLICEPNFPNRILNGDNSPSKCLNCNICSLVLLPMGQPLKCCHGRLSY